MDEKIKQRWVNALRSGKYRRGKNRLCTSTGKGKTFCCLGVLTDLYLQDHGGEWVIEEKGYAPKVNDEKLGNDDLLPINVMRWAGLTEIDPKVKLSKYKARKVGADDGKKCLSGLNDELARGFDEIARAIERTF